MRNALKKTPPPLHTHTHTSHPTSHWGILLLLLLPSPTASRREWGRCKEQERGGRGRGRLHIQTAFFFYFLSNFPFVILFLLSPRTTQNPPRGHYLSTTQLILLFFSTSIFVYFTGRERQLPLPPPPHSLSSPTPPHPPPPTHIPLPSLGQPTTTLPLLSGIGTEHKLAWRAPQQNFPATQKKNANVGVAVHMGGGWRRGVGACRKREGKRERERGT